ncbi:hypothetical protein PV325_008452 [Microctonus aethiopoides]|nr:hypothetical protein PV325_008452 [Microctonus aethiopoides]
MRVVYVGLLLLALTNAQKWNITLNSDTNTFKVHKDEVITVKFKVNFNLPNNTIIPKIVATTSDANIANISASSLLQESLINNETVLDGSVNITGIFLGKAEILLTIENDDSFEKLKVIVIRPARIIDKLFTGSVIALISILYINFGCAMDWKVCREMLKKPIGPLIGSVCQFIMMPMIAFGIGQLVFPKNPEMQIGIFFTGISPSGGASNIWTMILGGDLPLSIGMTTISTLASFGTIPLWIFTLGKYILDKGEHDVPYVHIGSMAIGLIIPLAIGYFIQRKFPNLCRIMVRIMKPFSIIVAGMGLPWLGFICGSIIMAICRQPQGAIRAIAIETGIQNTGIAIFLLRFMGQPDADLTTVIPVSCAVMTPIPLMILWLVKIIFDRRKNNSAASMEKLQLDANTPEEDEQKTAIMRKAFQMFDTTKSGFIDTLKISTILNTMGQLFDDAELNAIIEENDPDRVGKVNFDGFCKIAGRFLEEEDAEAMQEELKEAFRLYDREGNGYITTATLKEILGALDDKLTSSDLDGIIAEIDTDGSGTVDFDEFMEMMTGE